MTVRLCRHCKVLAWRWKNPSVNSYGEVLGLRETQLHIKVLLLRIRQHAGGKHHRQDPGLMVVGGIILVDPDKLKPVPFEVRDVQ